MSMFVVGCGGDDASKTYTMSFETYGGTEIDPITAVGGSMIFAPSNPEKSGSTFVGWYTNAEFKGDAVEIPSVMPNKNVKYYAKFDTPKVEYTVIYEYNKGQAPHAKDIPNVTVEAGESVTVADGNDYGAVGYMFVGWSIYPNGLVADVKQDGQYNAGDKITLTDSNIKLYAQWAVEYTDARNENDDKIYVYEPLIGKGKGAAKLVRADKDAKNLDGFVSPSSDTASGSTEFTFYSDEFEGGEFAGRLYPNFTYATLDGMQGQYLMYDYVYDMISYDYIMALDGFGYATYIRCVGDMINVAASGDYEYDPENGDYIFKYTDEKADDSSKPETSYFNIVRQPVEGTEYDGLFTIIGGESGTFYNINGLAWELNLGGYGNATLNVYDDAGQNITMSVNGVYYGTDNYESIRGEWQFEPLSAMYQDQFTFKFIVGVVSSSSGGYIPVFSMCDETVVGTYTSTEENDKSTLYLDGYGMAQYISNGVIYEGDYTVDEGGVVTLVCTTEEDGETVETERMVFVINNANMKFSVSKTGCVVNTNGVLTDYQGQATVVEIPEEATEIAADAFNYLISTSGVSLTSVTVPATVTAIGARAFQNNYSLRRAVFLGTTPAQLDYTGADDNPFRWGAGDFKIVVPDTAVDAYKTAWSAFADKIVGATAAAKLPEWVTQTVTSGSTEYTVLVQYNLQKELAEGELIDIVIPDYINAINSEVFRGMDFIKSVDLNNVILVGASAFYGCVNLETVAMPNVQSLGSMAFAACDKLNNSDNTQEDVLELPAIKIIGESAFSGCESLRLVQLGAAITEIGDFAFYQCNVYEDDPTLVVELMGDAEDGAPTMGSKITLGNIAFRFKVQNIDVALNCYSESTWSDYCRHLYIESGDEKGMYISGGDTLELDGRAVYQNSYVWMYAIDGEKITFYEYSSSSTGTPYATIEGKYKDGVISFALGSTMRYFTPIQEKMTYTTKDGKNTLECDPMDLQPESYENNRGYATVKFNGKEVQLYINGYSTKIIYNYEDEDGKLYDIYVDFNGETLDITKKLSPIRYNDITAPDGSKISILMQNDNIYIITAEFEIDVDTDRKLYWTEASGYGVLAEKNGNVYTFTFTYRSTVYSFTVTVSDDHTTFTYKHTTA